MRKEDIYDMLQEIDEALLVVAENYVKATEDKGVKEIVKVKIKNTMENLRSCLDYCLHDIDEQILNNHREVIYFPYKRSKRDFKNAINSNFKGLRNRSPKIYSALESVQDFNNREKPWLTILCKKTNKVKHDKSLKQTREDNFEINVGNGAITMKNCTNFNLKGSINGVPFPTLTDADGGNGISEEWINSPISIERIDWVYFKIIGTNLDVLEFLTLCKNEIQRMVEDIYLEMER